MPRYAEVPISFTVESVFRIQVIDRGLSGFALVEERLDTPYIKDYNAPIADGPGPIG